MKHPWMLLAAAALLGVCLSCGRPDHGYSRETVLRNQATAISERILADYPSGASVLLFVLTDTTGNVPAYFEMLRTALEKELAGGAYIFSETGPDLRRGEERVLVEAAMHEGWPPDLVDAWIRGRDADVIVSLVPLADIRRPGWPPVLSIEEWKTR